MILLPGCSRSFRRTLVRKEPHGLLLFTCLVRYVRVRPGHAVVKEGLPLCDVLCGQCLQQVLQVIVRMRVIRLRCFDQCEQGRRSFRPFDGIAEQPVAPRARKGLDAPLYKSIVGRDHRIIQETPQLFLLVQGVPDRIPELFAV